MSQSVSQSCSTLHPPSGKSAAEQPVEMDMLDTVEPRTPSLGLSDRQTLSHYRLVRLLGEGGMGQVYLAEDTRLERTVALKVMLPQVAQQKSARERFLREARMMAAVRNDHVVTIYEVDEADDMPFLAMELLHGQSLESWLSGTGGLPRPDEIIRIGIQIAAGLAAAQASGLIHRDIKPANIWLERPSGRVKILDFGLARPHQSATHLTETGAVVGTPFYMSPEQARGESLDGRTDLFSLGVVLYRLCTGRLPFHGKTIASVLTALAVNDPQPVRELNPDLPEALAEIITRLLSKDPAHRPARAQEVVRALRVLGGPDLPPVEWIEPHSSAEPVASAATLAPNALSDTLAEPIGKPPRRVRDWPGPRLLAPAIVAGLALTLSLALATRAPSTAAKDREHSAANTTVSAPPGEPLRIGIVYSRTGTMALGEHPIHDGLLLAINEINEQGGVLGRPLEAVIEDGQSDEPTFARKAEKLIVEDKVAALFGGWTSSSRKAMKEVVEKHDHLLLYPTCYEGMEGSPNVIYGGCVPNQQVLPALRWTHGFLNKRRWYLLGLDSVYSHAIHAIIRDEAAVLGCDIVGESMLPPGCTETGELANQVQQARPDLILNTVRGDTNIAILRTFSRRAITPTATMLSFSVSEESLLGLSPHELRGHHAAAHYFHSLDLPKNQEFLKRVRKHFDAERIVSPAMQTAYSLVHLWAQAVRAAGNTEVRTVNRALPGQLFDSPQGLIRIDPATRHMVQVSRVGRLEEDGRFVEVFLSPQPIVPEPYPTSRAPADWDRFLGDLHRGWGGQWRRPRS